MAVNVPELSVVITDGVVVSVVVPSNLMVTLVDGARLLPDIEIAVPAGPVDDNNEAVGVVPIVNDCTGALLPSDALMLFSAFAVAGTTKVAVKPPVELAVTAAGVVVSAVLLSVNLIGFVGIKLSPVILTV